MKAHTLYRATFYLHADTALVSLTLRGRRFQRHPGSFRVAWVSKAPPGLARPSEAYCIDPEYRNGRAATYNVWVSNTGSLQRAAWLYSTYAQEASTSPEKRAALQLALWDVMAGSPDDDVTTGSDGALRVYQAPKAMVSLANSFLAASRGQSDSAIWLHAEHVGNRFQDMIMVPSPGVPVASRPPIAPRPAPAPKPEAPETPVAPEQPKETPVQPTPEVPVVPEQPVVPSPPTEETETGRVIPTPPPMTPDLPPPTEVASLPIKPPFEPINISPALPAVGYLIPASFAPAVAPAVATGGFMVPTVVGLSTAVAGTLDRHTKDYTSGGHSTPEPATLALGLLSLSPLLLLRRRPNRKD
ncbi:MAG TPA: hypothetical protein VGN26_21975 [Armatimonadota bacterium]